MLDLSDGAIEVFNSKPDGAADVPVDDTIEVFAHKGKVEWDEDQSDHYSMKLQHLRERCLSFDPNERPDFSEVLRSIREGRPDFQAGLLEEPAASGFWDHYLLMPSITNLVCLRRTSSRNLKMY
jgi:hypothetical protein